MEGAVVGGVLFLGVVLVGLLLSVAFYFLPSILAGLRGTRRQLGIFLLNLLLGWTLVGWVVALVWAAAEERA